MKKIFNNQQGSILFMSIIILTGILMATLTVANLTMSGIILSGTQVRSTKAYFAADAGIEESLFWARASSTATSSLASDKSDIASSTLSNDATYSVDYTTWNSGSIIGTTTNTGDYSGRYGGYVRNFKSEGEYASLRRTVEAQYGYIPWDKIIAETCNRNNLVLCTNEVQCEAIGQGYWYSGICNASPPDPEGGDQFDYDSRDGTCDENNLNYCLDESDCEYNGGFWFFDQCNQNPCNCDNETNCTDAGGYWYNDVCNQNAE